MEQRMKSHEKEAEPLAEHGSSSSNSYAAYGPFLGRQKSVPLPLQHSSDSDAWEKEPAAGSAEDEAGQIQNHFDVGHLYEIDHFHLPPRTPVHLNSIRVAMVCEKTELNVSVRFASKGSLTAFFSYSAKETHPALDEKFVMGMALAAKVLRRKVPAEEYSELKNLESFWVVNSSLVNSSKNHSSVIQNNSTGLSDLECKFMVRWGTRRQVKYLGRHKESGSNSNQSHNSLSSLVNGTDLAEDKRGQVNEVDGDEMNEVDGDIEKNVKEKVEEKEVNGEEDGDDREGNEEEDYFHENGNSLKRKAYGLRNRNVKNAKKGKLDQTKKKERKQKKNPYSQRNKCKNRVKQAIILRNPKDRWSSERYKLAENNLLEVMKAKGATADKPLLRPQLRAEARKRIGDTGLLDHLLKHMAGNLAPGGRERFRRRHNPDGAMEYWLESADLVDIRKDAGVTDPYWVPPPSWKPGDPPTQDPICARDIKLLKDDISTVKRQMELMVTKMQLEEEVGKLRREIDKLSRKKEALNQAIDVSSSPSGISQKKDQSADSLSSKLVDGAQAIPILEIYKEQLRGISAFVKEMEEKIGKLSSNVKEKAKVDSALMYSTESTTEKAQKRLGAAATEEKAAHLKSGFRICKPQGTFLWPSMVQNNSSSSSNTNCSNIHPQLVVQVDVPTPPSVSSYSKASGPLQFADHPTSPVKPVAERRALTVTVSSVSSSHSFNQLTMEQEM